MRYWLLTGVLVLAGVALVLDVTPDAPALQTAVRGYPIALLCAAVLVAWRFERSRLAWAAVLTAVAYVAFALLEPERWPDLFAAACVLLPLAIAGLALAEDRPLGSPRGLMQLVLVLGVPATGAALVAARVPVLDGWLWLLRARPVAGDALALSRPALIAFAVAALVAGVVLWRRRRPTEVGLLLVLVPLLLLLDATTMTDGPARAAWLLAAGGVLALAVVESAFALAYHDELTGLPSRRALRSAMEELVAPYAIAVVDIDFFKLVNDRYGHDTGDQVLRMVSSRLARVRDGRAYRSGGEEFTLLFPGLDAAEAHERVEEVRVAIEASPFRLRGADRPKRKPAGARASAASSKSGPARESRRLNVTVSAGVGAASERGVDAELVTAQADRGLYTAKRAGRNRTVAPRGARKARA